MQRKLKPDICVKMFVIIYILVKILLLFFGFPTIVIKKKNLFRLETFVIAQDTVLQLTTCSLLLFVY